MSSLRSQQIITTGLAMFSMFFGAGNIVFPLMIGQVAGTMSWYATAGLLITAVGVPFMGLVAMTHYNGDFRAFFSRIGAVPGFLVTLFIMVLIGPVNAIPRCISLSYATTHLYIPALSQFMFSLGSCVVIFLATYRKSRIVDLLGQFLSPLLVVALAIIAIKGLLFHPEAVANTASAGSMFMFGFEKGYNTMDLLGTFFFASVIIQSLRLHFPQEKSNAVLASYALKASIIGASLLAAVYVGFAQVASYYGTSLAGLRMEELLGTTAHLVLGNAGGLVVSAAVALACLTTAITLVVVFAEFLQKDVFNSGVGYIYCLTLTLAATCIFANFDFSQIVSTIEPVLIVGYPVMILLTALNWAYKARGFAPVKLPVLLATVVSFAYYYGTTVTHFIGA